MPQHPSRRQFIVSGIGALAAGMAAHRAHGTSGLALGLGRAIVLPPPSGSCADTGALSRFNAGPFGEVPYSPSSITIGGLPFADRWFGDDFNPSDIPFHSSETQYPGGVPPEPTESVDIAVVGGGLSGLAAAYLLRHKKPVLLELHPQVGGTSVGARWRGIEYSQGGAYFITPDEGSDLQWLYRQLGLHRTARVSPSSDDLNELRGQIEPGFWSADGLAGDERLAFEQYRALVQEYVDNYPEIPLDDSLDNTWIRDLDRLSLKQHILQRLTVPVPDALQAAIQGYCFSSFNAGWDEISAAAGWNFIAAEEFGRWVLPGGNAGLIDALWRELQGLESRTPLNCPPRYLRAGCRAVDVRVLGPKRVQVTYKCADGTFRSLIAKRVVVCCPKHICRHILHGMREQDPQRYQDLYEVHTNAYVVANVLLTRRIPLDFYDIFLLKDASFPNGSGVGPSPESFSRATDVVKGDFTRRTPVGNGVLTLYWPLPFPRGRFDILFDHGFNDFATRIAPELDTTLNILGLRRRDVKQIRLSRWGHSMPIARPGLIASGLLERIRAPYKNDIFFVNQDNWCLPAVETCLIEAFAMRDPILDGL